MEISAEVQKVIKCTIYNTIYNTVFYFRWRWSLRAGKVVVKGTLSCLRQFLATESPFMMKKTFYVTSKGLFVLKIFKFLS